MVRCASPHRKAFCSWSRCIPKQASTNVVRCVINGSFDSLVMCKAQGMATTVSNRLGVARYLDLCNKNQAWRTGWDRLRPFYWLFQSWFCHDCYLEQPAFGVQLGGFCDGVAKLICGKWAMLEDTADHDEMDIQPVLDEPELIDLPAEPGPSHPPTSNLERCTALRLLHGRGPR